MTRRSPGSWAAVAVLLAACGRAPADMGSLGGDSLLAVGKAYYASEVYDSARAAFTQLAEIARRDGRDTVLALALTELGLAEWRLTRLDAAGVAQLEALRLKEQHGLSASLARSLNALGLLAHDRNRNREALDYLVRAAAAARAVGNLADEAKALGNQALPARNIGEFARAIEVARHLRAVGRDLDSARLEGIGLSNEAMVDLDLGNPRRALAKLDTSLVLYRRVPWSTGEQHTFGQMAAAWEMIGDYGRALGTLDTAVAIARRHGLAGDEAVNLRLIADVHGRLGDYRRAVRLYQQADSAFRALGLDAERGAGLRGAVTAYTALGNRARAAESAREALRLHAAAEEPADQVEAMLLLAELAADSGGYRAALPWLTRADTLAGFANRRGTRISLWLTTARIADRAGQSRVVLQALGQIGPEFREADLGVGWESSALAARAWARLGADDSAAILGHQAVAALERLRGSLASDVLRGSVLSTRADVYGDLVVALLRQGKVAEAFTVADAARSRGLLRHLGASRDSVAQGALPAPLAEADLLLQRIDQLTRRLRDTEAQRPPQRGSRSGENDELSTLLAAARAEYEALIIRTSRDHPREATLLGVNTVDPGRIQATLLPGQALVEYLLSSSQLVTFVMTRNGIDVAVRGYSPEVLTERVRLLRDLWSGPRGDWRLGLPASRALYADLIAPLVEAGHLKGIRELVLVPHGILERVPFAGLQHGPTGRYLVEDFTLRHLSSAAALPALAGASPATGAALDSVVAFAPFPGELPATVKEVGAIPGAGTRAVVGAAANEPGVRSALASRAVVHVATHGTLNARNPMFSRIELAAGKAASSSDDGRLEAHEVLGLRVRSPLVFLSGCETGAGREWRDDPWLGGGELTFAQAILAAGGREVVSTRWRIDDAVAATLAVGFYQSLSTLGAGAALAEAQRAAIRDGDRTNPYYWAGYFLSGIGQPVSQGPLPASVPSAIHQSHAVSSTRRSPP